jgi:hypothetical protein
MSNLIPVRMTKEELVAVLHDVAAGIEAEDSYGGFLTYDALDERLGRDEFFVTASYRIGNSMGQGGVRLIGEVPGADADA